MGAPHQEGARRQVLDAPSVLMCYNSGMSTEKLKGTNDCIDKGTDVLIEKTTY